MHDKSGESIEVEVSVTGTGESESERIVWGWRRPVYIDGLFYISIRMIEHTITLMLWTQHSVISSIEN